MHNIHKTRRTQTREPRLQGGKNFSAVSSSLHTVTVIQPRKGCHINNKTGCLEMLWNLHPFKEEFEQASGLKTGKK